MKLINEIFIFLILSYIGTVLSGGRTCYSCRGINCLRTSKSVTVKCNDPIDNCLTIFEGFEIVARGCYSEIESSLRRKCNDPDHIECEQCNKNLCNALGRSDFKCVQCNSKDDINCKNDISKLEPKRCPISSSPNSYCYSKVVENDVVIRGCSNSTKSQNECLNDKNCLLCLSGDMENCNNVKILENEEKPTEKPTGKPTGDPTGKPTSDPTGKPTGDPTGKPTGDPTGEPTGDPTGEPTGDPTGEPTQKPGGGGASSISITVALLTLPFLIQIGLIPCYKVNS